MTVISFFARYHAPGQDEWPTLEAALRRYEYDLEYNEALTKKIVDKETGKVLWVNPILQNEEEDKEE